MKASYIIAWEIAKASKPFSEGAFVKTCMLKAAELVCPDKQQDLANISLSRPTGTERVEELSGDLKGQLKVKLKSFIPFSIALDKSTDVTDVDQLAIFIRRVDASLNVTEELNWSCAVNLATDGAPSMIGRKAGVFVKLREKVHVANILELSLYTAPRGFVLQESGNGPCYEREREGKPVVELDNPEWTRDLAFLVDITKHLNVMNVNMQGCNKLVTEYYDSVRAFQSKRASWKT